MQAGTSRACYSRSAIIRIQSSGRYTIDPKNSRRASGTERVKANFRASATNTPMAIRTRGQRRLRLRSAPSAAAQNASPAGGSAGGSLARAAARNLPSPAEVLARNDSFHFFSPLGDTVRTGRTDTNVGDLQVLLVTQ